MTATLYHETSIDDLLETDPRIIIRKLLQSLADENDTSAKPANIPATQTSDKTYDTDCRGESDFDLKDELVAEIFGDDSPTPYNATPISDNPSVAVGAVQVPSPSSFCSSQVSIDDGYDGEDDFDATDDLADSIFGTDTPTRYFFPLAQQDDIAKTDDMTSSPQPFALPDISCRSRNLPSSSSDSEQEGGSNKFASTTENYGTSLLYEKRQCYMKNEENVDDDSAISDVLSRTSSDKNEFETEEVSVDTLRESATAISKLLIDLEVIETYEPVEGDDFGDFIVSVRPKALPDAPTLVAFRDRCDQITVPLEMACNKYAADIIRGMAEADNLVAKQLDQPTSLVSQVSLLPAGDVFTSSSDVDDDSDFESCDEEELKVLTSHRGRKRGRDDDSDFEDGCDDAEYVMKTSAYNRDPRKRRKI